MMPNIAVIIIAEKGMTGGDSVYLFKINSGQERWSGREDKGMRQKREGAWTEREYEEKKKKNKDKEENQKRQKEEVKKD